MDGLAFSSLNPYQGLEVIKARDGDDLLRQIKAIKKPIKIFFIVSHANWLHAFIQGDFKPQKRRKGSN